MKLRFLIIPGTLLVLGGAFAGHALTEPTSLDANAASSSRALPTRTTTTATTATTGTTEDRTAPSATVPAVAPATRATPATRTTPATRATPAAPARAHHGRSATVPAGSAGDPRVHAGEHAGSTEAVHGGGGGHGSDDAPGDDHGGSGGHGSDDASGGHHGGSGGHGSDD